MLHDIFLSAIRAAGINAVARVEGDGMSISTNHRLCLAALLTAVVCACSNGPANQTREYAGPAGTGSGGLVGPLKDDTSEQIVSWVDGQVVTDWRRNGERERPFGISTTPIPRREMLFGSQIPEVAGTDSGNPVSSTCRSCCSHDFDLDPNHENRARAPLRIWKRQAIVPAGREHLLRRDARSSGRTRPVRLR